MTPGERTDREYVAAVERVLRHIQDHLDEEVTPSQLARVAGFSLHHFHRVFRAVTGESVMDHIRRLRMEKAAYELKNTSSSVSEVAISVGYAHEAFTRVFQTYFGVTPVSFRSAVVSHMVPAACGVHFSATGFTALARPVDLTLIHINQLCELHRNHAASFEAQWQAIVSFLTGIAEFVYPWSRHGAGEKNMSLETSIDNEIVALEEEVEKAKQRLAEARRRRAPEPVEDYTFRDHDGKPIKLSELFGDKEDLIVVHNMGTGCSYCTMWADGFTGLVPHLSDRAAFVVISPDEPEVQKRFAQKRNWNFRMVSVAGTSFNPDMGFYQADSTWIPDMPGVSSFHKDADGKIYRIAKSWFGPGDDYCAVWPFLDLLQDGAKGWEPKYNYN